MKATIQNNRPLTPPGTEPVKIQSEVEAPPGTEPAKIQSAVEAPPGTEPAKVRPIFDWTDPSANTMQNRLLVFSLSPSLDGPDIRICLTDEVKDAIEAANKDLINEEKKANAAKKLKDAFESCYVATCEGRRQLHVIPWSYLFMTIDDRSKMAKIASLAKPKRKEGNTFADLYIECEKHNDSNVYDQKVRAQKVCGKSFSMTKVIDFLNHLIARFCDEGYERYVDELKNKVQSLEERLIEIVTGKNKRLAAYCPTSGCPCASGFLRPYVRKINRLVDPLLFTSCPNQMCMSANSKWCTECGPGHTNQGQLCNFQQIMDNHPERENFLEQINKGMLQKCPHCGWIQEKSDGCDKMTCAECRKWYCHDCGGPIEKNSDYLANHLLYINVKYQGTSWPCRKKIVMEAMKGNEVMVHELMNIASPDMRKKVIDDFANILENKREGEYETIPVNLADWIRCSRIPYKEKG